MLVSGKRKEAERRIKNRNPKQIRKTAFSKITGNIFGGTLHASRDTLHASRDTLHASRDTLHASRDTNSPSI